MLAKLSQYLPFVLIAILLLSQFQRGLTRPGTGSPSAARRSATMLGAGVVLGMWIAVLFLLRVGAPTGPASCHSPRPRGWSICCAASSRRSRPTAATAAAACRYASRSASTPPPPPATRKAPAPRPAASGLHPSPTHPPRRRLPPTPTPRHPIPRRSSVSRTQASVRQDSDDSTALGFGSVPTEKTRHRCSAAGDHWRP